MDVTLHADPREVKQIVQRERRRAKKRSRSLYDEDGIDGPWERAVVAKPRRRGWSS